MHHITRFGEAPFQTPQNYTDQSEGFTRATLADHTLTGCVHTGIGICQLEAGGMIAPHVHSFEEAFYILEGEVLASIDGRDYRLGQGDYGVIEMGYAHAWRNVGSTAVRWHETVSPQPRPLDHPEPDTFFVDGSAPTEAEPPDLQDPRTRCLGHFDLSHLPPPAQLQMDGYRGSSVQGISLRMMVDRFLGALHLTTFIVQFQPGGAGNVHDHPFEETYFILSGEAEAILDGQKYQVKAGDLVWTSVGGTHGFFNNTGSEPVRWLETQAPQPPAQQAFRFNSHWEYLAEKISR